MAPEPASQTAEAQLSEFGDVLWRAMFSVGFTAFIAALIFIPVLNAIGVIPLIETRLSTNLLWPYLLSSWLGLSLYLSSQNIGSAQTTESDESGQEGGESDEMDVVEEFWELIGSLSAIAYVFIMVGLASVAAMAVETYVSPGLAPAVAFLYPIVDWSASLRVDYPVTPSAILLMATYLLIIPVALVMTGLAAVIGFVFGLLFGLLSGLLTPVKMVLNWLKSAGVDEVTQHPFRGAKRRMGL
ncbi:hypothetical protein [Haloarcula amylolytica]|uniref:hypothetical protein n=1 Tax=Haloarcula amylolytica TaxID=396317 RepID=UPI003C715912